MDQLVKGTEKNSRPWDYHRVCYNKISGTVYPSESTIFDVQGIKIAITNDDLAEGLNDLSEYSRNVILMAFVLGLQGKLMKAVMQFDINRE